ncbi:MAG: SpoVR family protein [Nanoarchaeota archaeon]|nr:SpoVR family protein [Nanoarchaeota archaeon]
MAHWNLTSELEEMRQEVEEAARKCGLDFFPTDFRILDFDTLMAVTANNGFPTRYNHWHFGMQYEIFEKQMGHGFARIYELVINNNPAVAYLLQYNTASIQKMVMAHVYGHVDFFKNNHHFHDTDKNMISTMESHKAIVQKHIDRFGKDKVEEFIDYCLSIEDLIDFTPYIKDPKDDEDDKHECNCGSSGHESGGCGGGCGGCGGGCHGDDEGESKGSCSCNREEKELSDEYFPFPHYMKGFIKTENIYPELRKKKKNDKEKRPERDVLQFIIENNDLLKGWQRDILSIIRDEAYYLLPQMKTKVMNEGWATFWHQYMMVEMGLAGIEGVVHYTQAMEGILGGEKLNHYMIGYEIFRSIRKRWDEGRHGLDYENERDALKRMKWNTQEGRGLEKIFEVRATLSDVDFIRQYFTDELIQELFIYSAKYDKRSNVFRIASRDPGLIRNNLINSIFHAGQPVIEVLDGNFRNAKQLLLNHEFHGQELDARKRNLTLSRLFKIWKRPVCLRTIVEEAPVQVTFDGSKIVTERMQ